MKELAIIVDATQPGAGEQLLTKHLAPQSIDLVAFREKPMAADIETISFVMIRTANTTDHARI